MTYKSKMMIVMRRDLKMRKGKIAAQAGHACIEAILMALQKENRMKSIEKMSTLKVKLILRTKMIFLLPMAIWMISIDLKEHL